MNDYGLEIPEFFSKSSMVSQVYGLLSLVLLLAAGAAYFAIGMDIGFGTILLCFLGSLALMFMASRFRTSMMGYLCLAGFAILEGISLGPLLSHQLSSPALRMVLFEALGATTVIFVALTAYALYSGKNFSFMGGFLMAGLIAILVCSIVGIFFHNTLFHTVMAGIGILLFSGFILFDTSQIIHGEYDSPIPLVISLFLDILNLFLDLLKLLNIFSLSDD